MSDFPGFPRQAIEFFRQIAENNNREWFAEHKAEFTQHVQDPAQDFVVALGTRLQTISQGIRFDTALNGSGSIMRIYRDIRFSKDKSPYKTWQGLRFWEGKTRKQLASGIFFGFDAEGGGIHVGQHTFDKDFLARFREAVDQEATGRELQKTVDGLGAAGVTINGEQLKRVPRGYDPDHARGDLLKYKALYASSEGLTVEQLCSPQLVDICMDHVTRMAPLHHWLVKIAMPSVE